MASERLNYNRGVGAFSAGDILVNSPHARYEMRNPFDIAAYSPTKELILLAEVKWLKESSEGGAISFRKNLIDHGVLSEVPYFMLAFRNGIFLWKGRKKPDASPDFVSPAKPVLEKYLGKHADSVNDRSPESMELAFKLWLMDIARGSVEPDPRSEADQMLVDSGLFERIKGGEVRQDLFA